MRKRERIGAIAALLVSLAIVRSDLTPAAAEGAAPPSVPRGASAPRSVPPAAGEHLRSTRALAQRLTASGRGEARVTLTREDVMGGGPQVIHGTVALEPPDRVRIDFTDTGERIALRGDGGEWLQPALRQMIRLRSEQAGAASWLWDLFLHGGRGRFDEREAGRGRYLLGFRDEQPALPETLALSLDANGLPAALEVRDASLGHSTYQFAGWKFPRARGRAAFVIRAPQGYTVVEGAGDF